MARITIDVVIDIGCPFCYVALKRITRAIQTHQDRCPNDSIIIQWHPMILQPNAPKVSIDISTYIASVFGPEAKDAKLAREQALGRAEGINFNNRRKIGSTYDGHRLIHLAGEKSSTMQLAVVERLFKGHFEDGQDPSSRDFLMSVAVESGIERSEAKAWLNSRAGGLEVDEKIAKATMRGVEVVPDITIAGRYRIGTGYETDRLIHVLGKAGAEGV
ncbi:hypothetical protein COCVIDRAFT_40715 [Bipolaris victoriae FI3]|uniref:DSBA-like thioredoxin domain-containing protein n=1 Tax=Bipolaris victoriae (strain FI3) TaxID=930091 RepID=W7E684_BIPV3|nr:hypothetical protein COCVIDRAFT_40715 [Bipolaris victoriae FI3]